jgi:hypothetical protein
MIFTKGGLVLYETGTKNLTDDPISQLIQTVLIEVRVAKFFWDYIIIFFKTNH